MEVALSTAPACAQVPILTVSGEIDHGNLFDLTIAVGSVLRKEAPVILIDMSEVSYIDSGGLSVFFSILRQMNGGGWLGVIKPRPRILRMLEIIGLTDHPGFKMFSSLDDAERELLYTCAKVAS